MKEKRLDYELMRLLAIFCVVFNHSQERGFELYMLDGVSRVNYCGSLVLGILCKIAVPLFFLISGGLLLHREEPIRVTLKKRVLRIFAVLIVFSGILYLFWIRWDYAETPGIGDFLKRLWSEGISAPYWYLYTYLGLMILLPVLRPLAQNLSNRGYQYLIAIHFVMFGIAPSVGLLSGWGPLNANLQLTLMEPELFYFLMGYYLAHRFPWEKIGRKVLGICWMLAALSAAVMYVMADVSVRQTGSSGIGYHNGWMLFLVFAIYASARSFFTGREVSGRTAGVLSSLGGCVFGTYLLEGILRHYLGPLRDVSSRGDPPALSRSALRSAGTENPCASVLYYLGHRCCSVRIGNHLASAQNSRCKAFSVNKHPLADYERVFSDNRSMNSAAL